MGRMLLHVPKSLECVRFLAVSVFVRERARQQVHTPDALLFSREFLIYFSLSVARHAVTELECFPRSWSVFIFYPSLYLSVAVTGWKMCLCILINHNWIISACDKRGFSGLLQKVFVQWFCVRRPLWHFISHDRVCDLCCIKGLGLNSVIFFFPFTFKASVEVLWCHHPPKETYIISSIKIFNLYKVIHQIKSSFFDEIRFFFFFDHPVDAGAVFCVQQAHNGQHSENKYRLKHNSLFSQNMMTTIFFCQ